MNTTHGLALMAALALVACGGEEPIASGGEEAVATVRCGLRVHGDNLNGIGLNGIALNGQNVNGVSLNGVSLNGLRLESGMLVPEVGTPEDLEGAELDAVTTRLRIDAISFELDRPTYLVSALDASGAYQALCDGGPAVFEEAQ